MFRVSVEAGDIIRSRCPLWFVLVALVLGWAVAAPRPAAAEPMLGPPVLQLEGSGGASRSEFIASEFAMVMPLQFAVETLSLAGPSLNALFQFQKDNRGHPWLRITDESGRVERKVQRFDQIGLHGLSAHHGSRSPGPLTWSHIQRIDEVVTRAGTWRTVGAVSAGIIGAAINVDEGAGMTLAGLAFFGGGGAYLGDRFGSLFRSERNWYIADPTRRDVPEAVSRGVASTSPPAADTLVIERDGRTAAPSASSADAAILRACNRIGRNEVFRARGSFGSFHGRAGIVGPEGLEELHAQRRGRGFGAEPLERITWDQIDRIEVRGGSALYGALGGGVAFATCGALLGMALIAVSQSTQASVGEGAIVGAVITAPVGIVLGGLAGVAVRRWVTVYKRM